MGGREGERDRQPDRGRHRTLCERRKREEKEKNTFQWEQGSRKMRVMGYIVERVIFWKTRNTGLEGGCQQKILNIRGL